LKLTYTITEHDYLEFNLYHLKHSKTAKNFILFGQITIPVITAILVYITYADLLAEAIALIIEIPIFLLVFPKMFYSANKNIVKKMIKQDKINEFLGETIIELLEDKIRLTRKGVLTEYKYDKVTQICEDNERLYIYVGGISAILIPLIAFYDKKQKQEFIKKLEERKI